MQPNPEYVKEIQEIFNNAPFPNHLVMELKGMNIDQADIEIDLNTIHMQPYGVAHGGVLASIIDTATFWSAYMRIPEDAGLTSVDLKLNYLSSVRKGKLKAKGRIVRAGRSISYSEARVYDENDKLIAHGTSTLMTLPGKALPTKNNKFLS